MVKLSYSLSILLAIIVGVLAWEPPKLPAGRRLQYYILHPEGNYVFGYDTGEGTSHAAKSDTTNRVRGRYQYGGNASPGRLEYSYTGGFPVLGTEAKSSVGAGSLGFKDTFRSEAASSYDSGPADASYSFSYDAGDHSRQESSDAAGNVRGSFAFTAKDGVGRNVDYEAGAERGFTAKGAHLPVAPAAASSVSTTAYGISSALGTGSSSNFGAYKGQSSDADSSYSFSYDAGDHSRSESADARGNVQGRFAFVAKDGVERKVEYEAGAEKGFLAKGVHLPTPQAPLSHTVPVAPVAAFKFPLPAHRASSSNADDLSNIDRSYAFSYDAGDHSRQESADAAGNVRGHFAFVAKDGVNRKVDYEAGAEKGFIAKGAHIPVAPELSAAVGSIATPTSYYAPIPVVPAQTASNIESNPADGSYSFSYDAGDHSRKESADSAGNVRGHFSFVAKDGVNRKVDYEAGADTGFLAKGAHIPVDTSFVEKATSGFHATVPAAHNAPSRAADISAVSSGDGSYSFSYEADDHSRQESADAAGNVRGHFAFVAKDGVNRKVDYEAGAEKGFIAKGAHIPVAPELHPAAGPIATPTSYYALNPAIPVQTASNIESSPVDGSYSFSYDAGDHSRKESADSAGNVRGHFSFVAKDGVNRKVDYEAGADTGFLAKGAHIPVDTSFGEKATSGSVPSLSPFHATKTYNPSFPSTSVTSSVPVDGAYSFSYDAVDHAREESSDASGNVKGNYRFVAKDGINRKVEYEAGAEKGFVAKGEHLPTSSLVGGAGDLAYKYSYETDTSKKTETSDENGNVFGSFSYIGPDGLTRKVDYRAGGQDGFVATGDHLQSAVSPVAKHSSAFAVSSSSFSSSKPSTPTAVSAGIFASTHPSSFIGSSVTSSKYNSNVRVKPLESIPYSLHTFLPHTSPAKFGYVYDTLV